MSDIYIIKLTTNDAASTRARCHGVSLSWLMDLCRWHGNGRVALLRSWRREAREVHAIGREYRRKGRMIALIVNREPLDLLHLQELGIASIYLA